MSSAIRAKVTLACRLASPGSRSKRTGGLPEPEPALEFGKRRALPQARNGGGEAALGISPIGHRVDESDPPSSHPLFDGLSDFRVARGQCRQSPEAARPLDQLGVTEELKLSQSTRTLIAASRSRVSSSSKCAIWPSWTVCRRSQPSVTATSCDTSVYTVSRNCQGRGAGGVPRVYWWVYSGDYRPDDAITLSAQNMDGDRVSRLLVDLRVPALQFVRLLREGA